MVFSYFSSESIAARKKANKEKLKARHEKLYGKKNDAVKVETPQKITNEQKAYLAGTGHEFFKQDQITKQEFTHELSESPNKKKKTETIRTFERLELPNPLHDFATFTTQMKLVALTDEEVNFPYVLMNQDSDFVCAQTAGLETKSTTLFDKAGFTLEYHMQNLEIEAAVSTGMTNKHSQATNINFEVVEPFSMGLFVQNLIQKCALAEQKSGKKTAGEVNHHERPYCIILDYVGTDDKGQIIKPNQELSKRLRKIIPIQIKKVSFNSTAAGTTYMVEAAPWSEKGLTENNQRLNEDVTLVGKTVHEMLQSGSQSLQYWLNRYRGTDGKANKRQKDRLDAPDPKSSVLFFPNQDHFSGVLDGDQRASVIQDSGQGASSDFTDIGTQISGSVKILLGSKESVDVSNSLYTTGLKVHQTQGGAFTGNDIGASKMYITMDNINAVGNHFPKFEENYDAKKGTFTRDKFTIDFKQQTLTFVKGSRINDVIETVILLSEYGINLTKRTQKGASPGRTPWFRIVPQCFQLNNSDMYALTKMHPLIFVYNIIPYEVAKSVLQDPAQFTDGTTEIRQSVVKSYKYIYTGVNHDVLGFDIQYNFSFYQTVGEKLNKTSTTSATGEGESTEGKSKVSGDTQFRVVGGNKEVSSSSSIQKQDPTFSGAEGTQDESPELKLARDYNQKIINAARDLINCELEIVGDPYYLPNSGMSNYINLGEYKGLGVSGTNKQLNPDGDMRAIEGHVIIELDFRTPVDIGQNGDMVLPQGGAYQDGTGQTRRLGEFSGLFLVTKCRSSFQQNAFRQTLELRRLVDIDAKDGAVKENLVEEAGKAKVDNKNSKNNKSKPDAFGTGDNNDGLGVSA